MFGRLLDESGNPLLDESNLVLGDESYTGLFTLTAEQGTITLTGQAADFFAVVGVLEAESATVSLEAQDNTFIFRRAPEFNSNLVALVDAVPRTVYIQKLIQPTVMVPKENRTVHVEYNQAKRN